MVGVAIRTWVTTRRVFLCVRVQSKVLILYSLPACCCCCCVVLGLFFLVYALRLFVGFEVS